VNPNRPQSRRHALKQLGAGAVLLGVGQKLRGAEPAKAEPAPKPVVPPKPPVEEILAANQVKLDGRQTAKSVIPSPS